MAKKGIFMGMLAALLAFGFLLSSCATENATTKSTNFDKKTIALDGPRQYEVLGPVSLEKKWFGVLGFSFPGLQSSLVTIPAADLYVYQNGGVTYKELLLEAQKQYPGADAVVDINVDYLGTMYWIFYGARQNIVSGIAIKYVHTAPPPKTQASIDVNLK